MAGEAPRPDRPQEDRAAGAARERWVAVKTAPDQLTAEVWVQLLLNAQIPATVAPADAVSFLGLSPIPCRILVPEERVAEAALVLPDEP